MSDGTGIAAPRTAAKLISSRDAFRELSSDYSRKTCIRANGFKKVTVDRFKRAIMWSNTCPVPTGISAPRYKLHVVNYSLPARCNLEIDRANLGARTPIKPALARADIYLGKRGKISSSLSPMNLRLIIVAGATASSKEVTRYIISLR